MNFKITNTIETLINLAHRGEIDPWDVQVIKIIDLFLNESEITQSSDHISQQNTLSKSGQAFLWASMLVRFKADTLDKLHPKEIIDVNPDNVNCIKENAYFKKTQQLSLEKHLRPRNSVLANYQRRVTLQELINYIEEIAEELETSKSSNYYRRTNPSYSQREARKIVLELAHQENLTELAKKLEIFFQEQFSEFIKTYKKINFEDLLIQWHKYSNLDYKSKESNQEKAKVFWALLLLSSQSKVELFQEEFYQNLYIQIL